MRCEVASCHTSFVTYSMVSVLPTSLHEFRCCACRSMCACSVCIVVASVRTERTPDNDESLKRALRYWAIQGVHAASKPEHKGMWHAIEKAMDDGTLPSDETLFAAVPSAWPDHYYGSGSASSSSGLTASAPSITAAGSGGASSSAGPSTGSAKG